jgi:hypothetical protein
MKYPNDIVTDSIVFWITMFCLFGSAALYGSIWMVAPIVLAICVLVVAIKFGWVALTRE